MKLSKELSKRGTGRTLYILDEPTTGLHFEDTRKLLDVLTKLVDQGNTIVVIEHNLDVIKSADYVIDLGPEGGAGGGRIVAAGRLKRWPESIDPPLAQFLADPFLPGRASNSVGCRKIIVVGLPQLWGLSAVARHHKAEPCRRSPLTWRIQPKYSTYQLVKASTVPGDALGMSLLRLIAHIPRRLRG